MQQSVDQVDQFSSLLQQSLYISLPIGLCQLSAKTGPTGPPLILEFPIPHHKKKYTYNKNIYILPIN